MISFMPTAPFVGVLEGPIGEKDFGAFKIVLWTKRGRRAHFDPKRHGKVAREAAEQALEIVGPMTPIPNPCLVALDSGETDDGPHVYAHITFATKEKADAGAS